MALPSSGRTGRPGPDGLPPGFPLLAPVPTPAAGRACSQPAPCPGLLGPPGPTSPPLWGTCAMTSPCRVLSPSPRLGATLWGRPHSRDRHAPPRVTHGVCSCCCPAAARSALCPASLPQLFTGQSPSPFPRNGHADPCAVPASPLWSLQMAPPPPPPMRKGPPCSQPGPGACGLGGGGWTEAAGSLRTAGGTETPLRPTAVRASLPVAGRTPPS